MFVKFMTAKLKLPCLKTKKYIFTIIKHNFPQFILKPRNFLEMNSAKDASIVKHYENDENPLRTTLTIH